MQDLSTYQDILDAFYAIVGDTQAGEVWFSTDNVDSYANQCLSEIAEHCDVIEQSIATTTTAGTALYVFNALFDNSYALKRVEVDYQKVLATSRKELYGWNRMWQAQTGPAKWYYTDGLTDFDETGIPVALWPTPSASGVSLRAILSVAPSRVSAASGATAVRLPTWAVPGLLWGMLSMAYYAETRVQNLGAAAVYRRMYDDVLDRLRGRSYAKLPRTVAWGSKPSYGVAPSWQQLFPASGLGV